MMIVGVTIVRNARLLDYPILAAIQSVLPLVNRFVVNVGVSRDDTWEWLGAELTDPRIELLHRKWDDSLGGAMLAAETQHAMSLLPADWTVYVQADEVLHEDGSAAVRDAMARWRNDPSTEGLLVDFVHHYGDCDTVATSRIWYRREVRVVRGGTSFGPRSYHEAQGFRVGQDHRRVWARATGATYHHYGWTRPIEAINRKLALDYDIYGRTPAAKLQTLPWEYGLRRFGGSHPRAIRTWLDRRRGIHPAVRPPRWTRRQLRLLASDVIERTTGKRLFEYRNYELV
ncbi:MAG: hypothetical protein ACE5FJ_06130 [Gemmatimonadales bacterium]